MRILRLISTTAAILLLGVGAVSAQTMKTDETPTRAPAAQQNAPAEKVAPALKSGQLKAPETTGQAAPTTPEADKTQLMKVRRWITLLRAPRPRVHPTPMAVRPRRTRTAQPKAVPAQHRRPASRPTKINAAPPVRAR